MANADRLAYLERLRRCLEPGDWFVVTKFVLDGPERCGRLPVQRHDQEVLSNVLGADFRLDAVVPEVHTTPARGTRSFMYFRFRREA